MTTLVRQIGGGLSGGFAVGFFLAAGWLVLGPHGLAVWLTLIVLIVGWLHLFRHRDR